MLFCHGKKRPLLTAILLLISCYVHSDVTIVTENNPYALGIAKKVQEKITSPSKIVLSATDEDSGHVVVTLGNKALIRTLNKKDTRPLIAAFVSGTNIPNIDLAKQTDFFIEAELSPKQIHTFLAKNFPSSRIGFLYNEHDTSMVKTLNKLFNDASTEFIPQAYDGDTFRSLRALIRQNIDFVLIHKNTEVYTPENIRFVLESLFRKKIPVVTTSKPLVKSGASVAITPKESAVVSLTAQSVNQLLAEPSKAVELPNYVDNYVDDIEVTVNASMLDVFNIKLQGEKP